MNLLEEVLLWYEGNMTYVSIFLLMVIESSFIPFPSEVVIPPAVYVASSSASCLCKTGIYGVDVLLIILVGTLGATIGAVINYYLATYVGRPIVYSFADSKIGKMIFLSPAKIQKAETYFNEKGNMSTFIGRLIPGIRQLISIPAGLSKMKMKSFLIFTFAGALLWNTVLALLGYIAHGQKNLIEKYSSELSIFILSVITLLFLIWGLKKLHKYIH